MLRKVYIGIWMVQYLRKKSGLLNAHLYEERIWYDMKKSIESYLED